MNTKNLFRKGKIWSSTKIKEILTKFYPEHMFINVSQNTELKINVTNDDASVDSKKNANLKNDDIFMDSEENTNMPDSIPASKKGICDVLTITINNSNGKRSVVLNANKTNETNEASGTSDKSETINNKKRKPSNIVDTIISLKKDDSYVKLRSGKIIFKF